MVPAIYASVALNNVFLCYCVPDNNIIRLKGQIGYSAVGLSVNLMLYQKYDYYGWIDKPHSWCVRLGGVQLESSFI